MIVFSNAARKSVPDRDPRIVHIDQWQQLADKARDDALGTNFFNDTKDFFTLGNAQGMAPRFRPAIRIPELQVMCMKEANDLSEFQPQAYIYNQKSDSRVESFEQAFKAQWGAMNLPYHLLFAFTASQFCGTGFLNFGIDPYANHGRGKLLTKWIDGKNVHTDPNADYTCDWSFAIVDDWCHLDEVKRQYPEAAKWLPKQSRNMPGDIRGDTGSSGFRLPDGPWKAMPPFNAIAAAGGNSSRLRKVYFKDYSRELIGEMPSDPNVDPKYRWTYPRGRIIVECEGVVLADGACPFRRFPIIPVWGTPPLYGTWAVPPPRYSSSLQDLAERTYSQTYENFYRMNNGIWLIPESAQIEQGKFGGIPGEKCTYSGTAKPECVTPPAFPASATEMPEKLLQKQKEIHGFTQARQGNPGSGNLSSDLFDAAVLRGQSMTQLRGRLASAAVLDYSKLVAYSLFEYMPSQKMPLKEGSKFTIVDYKNPGEGVDDLDFFLDDGAFHVKSQAAVSKLAEGLMMKGAMPIGSGLEMLGYPEADKVAQDMQVQQALGAVTAVATGKGGKK